jgi:hypothetical protein
MTHTPPSQQRARTHAHPLLLPNLPGGRLFRVPSQTINLHLRQLAVLLEFDPADTPVKALRATGAMSLITACIDSDLIHLLGRWQSDAMLRYLHVQAVPVLQNFARQMNLHGQFQALPTAGVPIHQPQL